MNYQKIKQTWQELANRPDLIGREVIFDNRVGGCLDKGTISRIIFDGDFVTIESPEIAVAHSAGRAWSPNIRFKIDEERDPHLVGDTIFCDLDDYRQIRIKSFSANTIKREFKPEQSVGVNPNENISCDYGDDD